MQEIVGKTYVGRSLHEYPSTTFIDCTFDSSAVIEKPFKCVDYIFKNCNIVASRIKASSIKLIDTKAKSSYLGGLSLQLNNSIAFQCQLGFAVQKINLTDSFGSFSHFIYKPSKVTLCPNSYCQSESSFPICIDNNLITIANDFNSFSVNKSNFTLAEWEDLIHRKKVNKEDIYLVKKVYNLLGGFNGNKK